MKNKRYIVLLILVLGILLLPIIAMQFTDKINWDIFDFTLMGMLLFGTVSLCELILRKVKKPGYRILFCAIILILFFLIWAELAVGLFGATFTGS